MQKTKTLLGLIIVLAISFIFFQVLNQNEIVDIVRSFILPLVTILYYLKTKDSKSNFFYFLFVYSISEFIGVFSYFAYDSFIISDIMFYSGNLLYITAYIFLILEVLKSMNLKGIFRRFSVHIAILFAFDIYSVVLVSEIEVQSDDLIGLVDYTLVILYNTVIMLLLTVTLVNYLSRDSKKAMNLLLGALCIVFSEVIQGAYFYVSNDMTILSVVYSILLIIAFYFFYLQSSMSYEKEKNYEALEKLEA